MDAKADAIPPLSAVERSDRFYLLALVILLVPLKAWLLCNTEVAARDSIGYIRYALHLEQMRLADAMCLHEQHPGYAFCIWLVSMPLRALHGGVDADIMRVAAQTVSALAALLLIFPMFFLGKRLVGARAAFWGALLFQVMPVSAHHLADGISEPLFFLLLTTALWQAAVGLQPVAEQPAAEPNARPKRALFLAGVFGGLAYLTRPEGAFVIAAAGVVLLGRQMVRGWRVSWRECVAGGLCLSLPALAAVGLYILATGSLTRKLAPKFIAGMESLALRGDRPREEGAETEDARTKRGLDGGGAVFASFIPHAKDYPTRLTRGARALALELMQGFHYVGAIGFLLGLWWFGGRLARQPGFWVIVGVMLLQAAALLLLAVRLFYISDRHTMVIILPGCPIMAAGIIEFARRLRARFVASSWGQAIARRSPFIARSSPAPYLLVGLALCSLPKTLEPVHYNRAGNHVAGLWLRDRMQDGDLIEDDHCWSHYYAGRVFVEGREPDVKPDYAPKCYVVMTRSNVKEVDDVRKGREEELRRLKAGIVFHWPEKADAEKARVVIYELPRDRDKQPWRVAGLK
ncbi:MAG: glycosyltransferase family 39 protein [Gemmataceae bacterium]